VIQLDADIEQIRNRDGFGMEKYETEDFQRNVRDNFKKFEKYSYWNLMEANREQDIVHKEIVAKIEELLENYNNRGVDDAMRNFYPNNIGEDLFSSENM
jgi:thymidylate kinase